MRRRSGVQRRRVVFIGVEGKSDRAFVKFLGRVCDDEGLHLHLDVKPASGGDSVAVVEEAGRRLKRHPDFRVISKRLVLLDSNLEALLVRLHEGRETHEIAARDAERQLRKQWPKYSKGSLSAEELKRRFTLTDLRRAARHDEELRKLLVALGL